MPSRISIEADQLFGTTGIVVKLPELDFDDWEKVVVRARTSDRVFSMVVGFNYEGGVLPQT